MPEWTKEFASRHGGRIIFILIALAVATVMIKWLGMVDEGKVIYVAVATLALNQARGAILNDKDHQ